MGPKAHSQLSIPSSPGVLGWRLAPVRDAASSGRDRPAEAKKALEWGPFRLWHPRHTYICPDAQATTPALTQGPRSLRWGVGGWQAGLLVICSNAESAPASCLALVQCRMPLWYKRSLQLGAVENTNKAGQVAALSDSGFESRSQTAGRGALKVRYADRHARESPAPTAVRQTTWWSISNIASGETPGGGYLTSTPL